MKRNIRQRFTDFLESEKPPEFFAAFFGIMFFLLFLIELFNGMFNI